MLDFGVGSPSGTLRIDRVRSFVLRRESESSFGGNSVVGLESSKREYGTSLF